MMSQLIQFLSSSTGSAGCLTAVAPVVVQGELVFTSGNGATITDLVPALASGSPAAFGGQIVNTGCYDLLATFTYLQGDDCNECTTPDTLTTVVVTVEVPKNSSFPIPDGFITRVQVQTIDTTDTPINVQKDQTVYFYSAYKPSCVSCKVLVP